MLLIWIAEYLDGFFSHCASNITIDLHNTQMTKSEWAMCFILFHMCFEYLSWSFLIYHPIPIIRLFLGIVMSETLFRNATCQLRSRKPLPDTWIAQRRSRIHEIGHDGLGRLGLRNRARLKKRKTHLLVNWVSLVMCFSTSARYESYWITVTSPVQALKAPVDVKVHLPRDFCAGKYHTTLKVLR